jgi:hypothetical protein
VLRRRSDDAQQKITAHKNDISEIRKDLKQLKGRVDQQMLAPAPPIRFFPPLFKELRVKRWALLWRGSRDGFTAREFHLHCDGCANTLTLIRDTNGNSFDGFMPVE